MSHCISAIIYKCYQVQSVSLWRYCEMYHNKNSTQSNDFLHRQHWRKAYTVTHRCL